MQTKDAIYSAIFKKARSVTKEHKCIVNHMRVFQFEIIPNSIQLLFHFVGKPTDIYRGAFNLLLTDIFLQIAITSIELSPNCF